MTQLPKKRIPPLPPPPRNICPSVTSPLQKRSAQTCLIREEQREARGPARSGSIWKITAISKGSGRSSAGGLRGAENAERRRERKGIFREIPPLEENEQHSQNPSISPVMSAGILASRKALSFKREASGLEGEKIVPLEAEMMHIVQVIMRPFIHRRPF